LALQLDQSSLVWRELRDVVLSLPAESADTRQALSLLESWDGVIAIDSPAAAAFEFFVAEIVQRVAKCKAPRAAEWTAGKGFTPLVAETALFARRMGHLVRLTRERPAGWFARPWEAEMADAMATAIATLRERYGADPAGWAWGRIRPLTLRHAVGEQAPMDRIFNLGPFAWGGDTNTIGQTATDLYDPTTSPSVIASMRLVIEVGNWEEARYVLPGGQSGNPLSPHYGDQLGLWQEGKAVQIAWSQAKVQAVCQEVLRLEALD
jgi:penicillin amidase